MDWCELAWAAGFFDGEGWANAVAQKGRRTRQPQARVNQASPDGVPQVLLRLQAAVGGLGRIGGPQRQEKRIDLYRWEVSSRRDVERLLEMVAPWLGDVKQTQLAQTLGRQALRSMRPDQSQEWRAWAAGLYDGEGSLYLLDHRTHDGYRTAEMAVTQSSGVATPEVLQRFAHIVATGHINGPYQQKDANLDVYRWKTAARGDIEDVVTTLWPWLGVVKQAQTKAVLDVIRSQSELPRGRAEWGSHKTHCIHGHEYANARVRPYMSRGVGMEQRDSEQCLQCAREQARERREQKKRPAVEKDRRSLSEHWLRYLLK